MHSDINPPLIARCRASRSGSCGPLPPKLEVHALHAAALAYPAPPARAQTAGVRGWLDWVLRR
jgi:hypothetical protein